MSKISNTSTGVEIVQHPEATEVNANPVMPYNELPEVKVTANRIYRFSDNSKDLTSSGESKGWYYDDQLSNPLTSVRLLTNAYPEAKEDGKIEWKDLSGYDEVIMHSIINEDFNVEISNGWEDQGGDFLSGTLNSILKPLAPYGEVAAKALEDIRAHNVTLKKEDRVSESTVGKVLFGVSEAISPDLIRDISQLGQGTFVSQGTSFTTYGGTGINFGLLGMKFTLFPTWVKGKMVTVIDQIEKIIPYSVGNLEEVNWEKATQTLGNAAEGLSTATNVDIKGLLDKVSNSGAGKAVKDAINKYLKWQRPPGGYRVDDPLNIDVESFPGTLCLEVGTHYKLSNLVISNISMQFSKQMVKDPSYFIVQNDVNPQGRSNNEVGLSPLYCDVNIILKPMTKYSLRSMREFINGNVDTRKTVVSGMYNDLKEIKKRIKGGNDEEE